MSAIADYPLPQQRSGRVHGAVKQLEEMFTSVQVNRFLFRVKEQPQEAYSFTLNGKTFRSGPERYLKNCSAE